MKQRIRLPYALVIFSTVTPTKDDPRTNKDNVKKKPFQPRYDMIRYSTIRYGLWCDTCTYDTIRYVIRLHILVESIWEFCPFVYKRSYLNLDIWSKFWRCFCINCFAWSRFVIEDIVSIWNKLCLCSLAE